MSDHEFNFDEELSHVKVDQDIEKRIIEAELTEDAINCYIELRDHLDALGYYNTLNLCTGVEIKKKFFK